MPRRRPFGSVIRRRRSGHAPDGTRLTGHHPGYYVRIRRGGKEVCRYGGPDRQTALELLRKLQRQAERRDLLDEEPESDLTFAEFVPEYLEYCRRNRTRSGYVTTCRLVENILLPYFADQPLREIRRVHIERFLATRQHAKGATRNRALSILSSIFARARVLNHVSRNPVDGVKRAKEPQAPLPLVPLEDQDRLLRALQEPVRGLVLTALETGMRLGELLRLDWRDVDFSTGTILVRESKGKRPRLLAMSSRLRAALVGLYRPTTRPMKGGDLVFPGAARRDRQLNESWRLAYKAAAAEIGHPELRFHDLRHLTAINLVRAGLDLPAIQAVLGHRSLVSTLRYASYADDSAAERAAKLLDRVREGVGRVAAGDS